MTLQIILSTLDYNVCMHFIKINKVTTTTLFVRYCEFGAFAPYPSPCMTLSDIALLFGFFICASQSQGEMKKKTEAETLHRQVNLWTNHNLVI